MWLWMGVSVVGREPWCRCGFSSERNKREWDLFMYVGVYTRFSVDSVCLFISVPASLFRCPLKIRSVFGCERRIVDVLRWGVD